MRVRVGLAIWSNFRVRKFHLVGSAAGGQIAVDYALSTPERLLSLSPLACAVGGMLGRGFTDIAPFDPKAMTSCRRSFASCRRRIVRRTLRAQSGRNRAFSGYETAWPGNVSTIWLGQSRRDEGVPTLVLPAMPILGVPPPMARAMMVPYSRQPTQIVPECGLPAYWERPDVFGARCSIFQKHAT
jgi:pimeloyl-ACP methyl ester carboxylesterase